MHHYWCNNQENIDYIQMGHYIVRNFENMDYIH